MVSAGVHRVDQWNDGQPIGKRRHKWERRSMLWLDSLTLLIDRRSKVMHDLFPHQED